jgi:hypothetical protein
MADNVVGVLKRELAGARQRVSALEQALNILGGADGAGIRTTGKRRGRRRKMSAAQKKAVSERMRKYWAARKKSKR